VPQQAGLVRADLVADDLTRIVVMLNKRAVDDGPGKRRLAALRGFVPRRDNPPERARPLPGTVALRYAPTAENWPV